MRRTRWWIGALAVATALTLVACRDQSAQVAALKDFTSSASSLTKATFYQEPDSNLATALLNRAEHAKEQVERVRPHLTEDQQAAYTQAADKLAAAKLLLAADTEIKHVLGTDSVIVDPTYSNSALRTTYGKLKHSAPKFASSIAAQVKLIDGQVAALQALRAAQAAPADAQLRAAARAAIRAVATPGFQETYLPQVAALEPAAPDRADQSASQSPSSADTGTASTPTSSDQAASDTTTSTPTQPAVTPPAQTAGSAATDSTATPADEVETPSQPADEPEADTDAGEPADDRTDAPTEPMLNGPYDTMDAAIAAMKAAQGDSGRPATAYSVTAPDGSLHYAWKWTDTEE